MGFDSIIEGTRILDTSVGAPALIPAAGFTGPGDVVSGGIAWWGLWAYSAAAIGTKAIRLRENSGNTESDFNTVAGGGLDLAGITSFKGAASLFVTKIYDQTGNGNDFVQATAANQPPFILSSIGLFPAIVTDGTTAYSMTAILASAQAQPFTLTTMAARTDWSSFAQAFIVSFASSGIHYNFNRGDAGTFEFAAPTLLRDGITTNPTNPFASIVVANSTSSIIRTNATEVSGDAGTRTIATSEGVVLLAFDSGTSGLLPGKFGELGIWPGGFSPTQRNNMITNIKTTRWNI